MTNNNFITSYPAKRFHPNKYHSISSAEHLQPLNIKFSCRELMSNTKITFSRHLDSVSNAFKLLFFCVASSYVFCESSEGELMAREVTVQHNMPVVLMEINESTSTFVNTSSSTWENQTRRSNYTRHVCGAETLP